MQLLRLYSMYSHRPAYAIFGYHNWKFYSFIFLCILETQPYFTYCRRFLHGENTAKRTTNTASQPAGSTVVHGHSPPPETVVFGGFILPLLAVLQINSHCRESNRSLKMVVGACQSC